MDRRLISLIVHGMIHIHRFKEELARAVDDRFLRQDVCHMASGGEANPRAHMIVLADIAARLEPQLRDSHLICTVEVGQEPSEHTLIFDFRH